MCECDGSRLRSGGDVNTAALRGLTLADGEMLKGRAPGISLLMLFGLDFCDWDLVILLLTGVGRRERLFWPPALIDFLFVSLLGTIYTNKKLEVSKGKKFIVEKIVFL